MPREKLAVLACANVALLFLIAALLLAVPASAACPPVVPGATPTVGLETTPGSGCTACWTAVTTNTDGTPVTPPISYRGYVYQGTPPIIGTTAPKFTATATEQIKGVCVGLTPGQLYNVAVTAVAGAVPAESALSTPFSFIPDAPRKVTGAGLR